MLRVQGFKVALQLQLSMHRLKIAWKSTDLCPQGSARVCPLILSSLADSAPALCETSKGRATQVLSEDFAQSVTIQMHMRAHGSAEVDCARDSTN